MTLLDKSAILACADIITEDVFVPAWNGTVRIRGLTAEAWDEYQAGIVELKGNGKGGVDAKMNRSHMRARLVARAIVDEHGELLFKTAIDVADLSRKSAKALDFLFDAVKRISGVTDADLDEEMGKSGTPPSTGLAIA